MIDPELLAGTRGNRVLARSRNRLHLAPHPALRPFVSHYTVTFPALDADDGPDSLALVPDASGCAVFRLSGCAQGTLWGATTRTVHVARDYDSAPIRLFVEFRPGGLYRLTGIRQSELTDCRIPLKEVLPALQWGVERALEAPDCAGVFDRLDALLFAMVRRQDRAVQVCGAAAGLVLGAGGKITVRGLAEQLCYTPRHLTRVFQECLGMDAKTFARLVRVNAAVRRLGEGRLTDLALEAGYYDQSHFIRDFAAVCGVSPGRFLTGREGFYQEEFKL